MNVTHLIVDGYCLMHRDPALRSHLTGDLMLARQHLVRKVASCCDAWASQITVVFDGQSAGSDPVLSQAGIEVVYSAGHETADTVIERMTTASGDPDGVLVITSDRAEIDVVTGAGGHVMSCVEFLDRCEKESRSRRPTPYRNGPRGGRATLGDFFPE